MPDVAVIVYLLCLVEKRAARAVMNVTSFYDSLYPRLSITLEVLLTTVCFQEPNPPLLTLDCCDTV